MNQNLNQKRILYGSVTVSLISFLVVVILAWYMLDRGVEDKAKVPFQENSQDFLKSRQTEATEPAEDTTGSGSEADLVVQAVSRHMLFPEGKITVATVLDASSLHEQNPIYFQYVKNGDKLLYYPHGVIIYDAVADKIVDIVRLYSESAN
ncbi:MAG: hypothetical protein HYY51_01100 [Candidatus Magasanikbacteria bacterium]|nr:hypothetical protein [Candidatus Magasanikbacteria bacterium]